MPHFLIVITFLGKVLEPDKLIVTQKTHIALNFTSEQCDVGCKIKTSHRNYFMCILIRKINVPRVQFRNQYMYFTFNI